MRIRKNSATPNEKNIYVAAVAQPHKCLVACIIVDYYNETTWAGICKPFSSGFHNVQEKLLYAESFALQKAKSILRNKGINPDNYNVYFGSLREKYKSPAPSPITLDKTLQLALQAKQEEL